MGLKVAVIGGRSTHNPELLGGLAEPPLDALLTAEAAWRGH